MKRLALLGFLALTLGCSSGLQTTQEKSRSQSAQQPKEIQIISEPAGARIEVNDDYVGDAPITIKVPQNNGRFTKTTLIRALPIEAGNYVQTKSFYGPEGLPFAEAAPSGADIPSRILFDMRLTSISPSN
jgi:hypothetical protein